MFGTFEWERDDEPIVYGLVDQPQFFNPLKHQVSEIITHSCKDKKLTKKPIFALFYVCKTECICIARDFCPTPQGPYLQCTYLSNFPKWLGCIVHLEVFNCDSNAQCIKIIKIFSFEFSRQKWHIFSSIVNF